MENNRYLISEAAQKTGLETHVLRYWEDELKLIIPRNELGHRYYTDELINLFIQIKEMKEKGYQLKAIKSELEAKTSLCIQPVEESPASKEDKLDQFKSIISGIVTDALAENNQVLQAGVSTTVSEKVIKEMDYLLRMKEEAEEERYKKLDETIRNCQRSNKEAAAGLEKSKKKRKW